MTTIYEVARGDYIRVSGLPIAWIKIAHVEAVIDQVDPLHYREWAVVTTAGLRFTMFDIAAYRTKAEMQAETEK